MEGDTSNSPSAIEARALASVSARIRAFPPSIGRYQVVAKLGEGGMGIVYAAVDPELQRRVAIKVLTGRLARRESVRVRLTREARLIAAIDHPNVVEVYEVGEHESAPYIAMELVAGEELQHWLQDTPRSWQAVVAVFRQAALALQAAHACDIVHRDFKPSNVLVSEDGRARVLDFGLALHARDLESGVLMRSSDQPSSVGAAPAGEDTERLTQTGALLGTPAYMAPEQHLGGAVDAATDQFAFCVALWEALAGIRPFRTREPEAMLASAGRKTYRVDAWRTGTPRGIESVLRRGLSLDPADRWPSMAALIDAIDRVVSPGRAYWWAAAGIVAVATTSAAAGLVMSTPEQPRTCAPAPSGMWTPQRSDQLQRRFNAAKADWGRARPRLEDFVEHWTDAWERTCDLHDDQQTEARTCLEQTRSGFSALLADFDRDDALIAAAPELLARLRAPHDCLETASHAAPSTHAAALDETLARARALHEAGHDEASAGLARKVADAAEVSQDRPRTIAALAILAASTAELRKVDEAIEVVERAQAMAVADDNAIAIMRTAAVAADIELRKRGDHHASVKWYRHAEAAGVRAGLGGMPAVDRVYFGFALWQAGEFEDATEHLGEAIDQLRETRPDDPSEAVTAQLRLSGAATWLAKHDLSHEAIMEAQEIARNSFGDDSLTAAAVAFEYGEVLVDRGRLNEAEAEYRHALRVFEAQLPPLHWRTLKAKVRLGWTLLIMPRLPEAIALLREAADGFRETFDAPHPYILVAEGNLVQALEAAGQLDEAAQRGTRLLDDTIAAHGPDHAVTADALTMLGEVERSRGNAKTAREHLDGALKIYRGMSAPVPVMMEALRSMAKLERDAGKPERALELAHEMIEVTSVMFPADSKQRDGLLCDAAPFFEAAGEHAKAAEYRANCAPVPTAPRGTTPPSEDLE